MLNSELYAQRMADYDPSRSPSGNADQSPAVTSAFVATGK